MTLISPGAAPRRALRYSIKAGQHATLDMLTSVNVQMETSGHALPNVPVPPIRSIMSLQVKQADAAGFAYDFRVDRYDVQSARGTSPALLSILHKKLSAVVGVRGTAAMTSRGFIHDVRVDVPSGVDPTIRSTLASLQHSIRNMANPLPQDPVGVGARWDVTSQVTVNSMRVQQVVHCRLVSLGAQRFTLDERLEQTAPPQRLHLPNLPAGSSVELDGYHAQGKGKVVIDTSKITRSGRTRRCRACRR